MRKRNLETGLDDRRKQCGENRHSNMNLERCSAQSETSGNRRDETNELQHRRYPGEKRLLGPSPASAPLEANDP